MKELTVKELADYIQDTKKHINYVQIFMSKVVVDLLERSYEHDLSKFSNEEALIYAKVTPMFKGLTYGTPEHKEVSDKLGPAWEHHKNSNDHHTGYHENGINDMNLMSIIEMVCDWKAASMRDPNQKFEESCLMNCKKYGADDQLTRIIMNTAFELGFTTKGEN